MQCRPLCKKTQCLFKVSQTEGFRLFAKSSLYASKNTTWLREALHLYQNTASNTQNQKISVFIPCKQTVRTLSPALKSPVYGIEMKIRIRWRFTFKEHLTQNKWNLKLKFSSSWYSSFSLSLQLAKTLCVKNQVSGKHLGNNFLRLHFTNTPWPIAAGTMTSSPSPFMPPTWWGILRSNPVSFSLVATPALFQWNCGHQSMLNSLAALTVQWNLYHLYWQVQGAVKNEIKRRRNGEGIYWRLFFQALWLAFHIHYLIYSPLNPLGINYPCPILDSDTQQKDICYLSSCDSGGKPLKA